MTRIEEKIEVATHCSHFRETENAFSSGIGNEYYKSCDGCRHFNNQNCSLDVYDSIAAKLDK